VTLSRCKGYNSNRREIWAILGNALQDRWQEWQQWQRKTYNLQIPQPVGQFESHPHRQN
jgi:hypothetical protein